MEKKNDKKINWKKVVTIGGAFAAGIVVGVVGSEKVLSEISLDGMSEMAAVINRVNGRTLLHFTLEDRKTGRKLTSYVDKNGLNNFLEMLLPLVDEPEFK